MLNARDISILLILLTALICDNTSGLIPNTLLIFSAILSTVLYIAEPPPADFKTVHFLLPILLFFLILRRRGKIGGGDIKLFIIIMLFYPDASGLYIIALSFLFNLIYGLVRLILLKRHDIPMATGAFASALFIILKNAGGLP
ncbi:MAG: prepilin peptidase [Eubacteriales bacterium]|nr:prepilin peptidase [Eubacteriales bacterium]